MSEWNKQIANSLMGYAASDPSTGDVRNKLMDVVTNRATFFPAADYADGTTRWAWPKVLHDPPAAWAAMLGGDTSPANAMTVAGAAMAGSLPFAARRSMTDAAPQNRAQYAFGNDTLRQIHEAKMAANPSVDPNRLTQVVNYGGGVLDAVSPAGLVSFFHKNDGWPVEINMSGLHPTVPHGQGYGSDLYRAVAEFAKRLDADVVSDTSVSPEAQRVYRGALAREYGARETQSDPSGYQFFVPTRSGDGSRLPPPLPKTRQIK